MAQFGISRMTVNRALRELVEQGRIVRVAGVGSFVAENKPQSTLLQIANIASEIRARGHDYRCELLAAERIAASPDVAAWLDLRAGESVFHSVCLHLENDMPVQLEDRYVNPHVVPDFLEQDFAAVAAQRIPGAQRALRPDRARGRCRAAHAPSRPSASRCRATDPCLLLTRRTWTRTMPVTLVRCLHPASRYRLGSRFRADGNPSFG